MLFIVIFVATLVVAQNFADKLVPSTSKCHIKDSQLISCVVKALNSLKSRQLKVDDKIQLPSLDPFVVPKLVVSQESELANFSAKGWNFTIYGMKSYDIREMNYNPATMNFHIRVEFNPLLYETGYDVKGHVISIPMEGKGVMGANFGSISVTIDVPLKLIRHGNVGKYSPTGMKIGIQANSHATHFVGLFGQNKELNRLTNEALNINSKFVLEALTPFYETLSEAIFIKAIKSITKIVLDNEIMLDS